MLVPIEEKSLTKSELIEQLAKRLPQIQDRQVAESTNLILKAIAKTLANGNRIEVRGFGSFSLRVTEARTGRNPKTGEIVAVQRKSKVFFKPSREMIWER